MRFLLNATALFFLFIKDKSPDSDAASPRQTHDLITTVYHSS